MPFSHHSHSGQFCGHATNTLEEVIQSAIAKGMHTFCLTEHIGRDREDFYPREEESHTVASLAALYDTFYATARKLQKTYETQIQLLVGFEGEWIRSPNSERIMRVLLDKYPVDLFVGSVHHLHTHPIDYDRAFYEVAREMAGGSDERLAEDYFDQQLAMLQTMRPLVVGHFDLIRLMSDDPNRDYRSWPGVWERAIRNLRFIAEYGGVLELNSSALRKGLKEMYPMVEICKEFIAFGGRFTLSDDSHGVPHVALNYDRVRTCMSEAGITSLVCLAPVSAGVKPLADARFSHVGWKTWTIEEVNAQEPFWNSQKKAREVLDAGNA